MIDITNEKLIALRDVPRQLPARPSGRRLHISAVYRWVLRGIRGVRLESIQIGGTTYTSAEALQRFAEQQSKGQPPALPSPATTATRQRQIEAATRQVEAILGRPGAHDRRRVDADLREDH